MEPEKKKKSTSLAVSKTVSSIRPELPQGYYLYPITEWKAYLELAKERFFEDFPKRWTQNKTLNDFIPMYTLGAGSYGKVILVRLKESEGGYYAMKVVDKDDAIKNGDVSMLLNERRILGAMVFPFCVHLVFFFMDSINLYYVMPFVQGGEMFQVMQKSIHFSEEQTKFYAAQVILALEYMHTLLLMHRDLKPENILFETDGYIKLTDFGLSKMISKGRTFTICGTPDYMAPEVLKQQGYSFSADWWSLGVLLFEMSAGYPPFESSTKTELHSKVLRESYSIPKYTSSNLKSLIKGILKVNVTQRLGCMKAGVSELKKSPFFHGISWLNLLNKRVKAPLIPKVTTVDDASNFKTAEAPKLPFSMMRAVDRMSNEFRDF